MAQNSIEAPQMWDIDALPEIEALSHKFTSTMTTIFSKHGMEIKSSTEDATQILLHSSKKKLRELISKHNSELFSFMMHPEKLPSIMNVAETIFRKYGQDAPTIKGHTTQQMLKDLQLDVSLEPMVAYFDDGLKQLRGDGALQDFMKQLRWVFSQYRIIGEEVLRLETLLFQKMEVLDKLQNRIPLVTTGLAENEALPELIGAFSKYATHVYISSHFEETYTQLVEEYKKWNMCRQLVCMPNSMAQGKEPQCSICLMEPISNAIVPCGHTFCGNCSKKQSTTCFMCRGQIRERIKLYFT